MRRESMEEACAAAAGALVPMTEAAARYTEIRTPLPAATGEAQLNGAAEELSRLLPLYVLSPEGRIVGRLKKADMRGGRFRGGGAELVFDDGRMPIQGIATTRAALDAAIALSVPAGTAA